MADKNVDSAALTAAVEAALGRNDTTENKGDEKEQAIGFAGPRNGAGEIVEKVNPNTHENAEKSAPGLASGTSSVADEPLPPEDPVADEIPENIFESHDTLMDYLSAAIAGDDGEKAPSPEDETTTLRKKITEKREMLKRKKETEKLLAELDLDETLKSGVLSDLFASAAGPPTGGDAEAEKGPSVVVHDNAEVVVVHDNAEAAPKSDEVAAQKAGEGAKPKTFPLPPELLMGGAPPAKGPKGAAPKGGVSRGPAVPGLGAALAAAAAASKGSALSHLFASASGATASKGGKGPKVSAATVQAKAGQLFSAGALLVRWGKDKGKSELLKKGVALVKGATRIKGALGTKGKGTTAASGSPRMPMPNPPAAGATVLPVPPPAVAGRGPVAPLLQGSGASKGAPAGKPQKSAMVLVPSLAEKQGGFPPAAKFPPLGAPASSTIQAPGIKQRVLPPPHTAETFPVPALPPRIVPNPLPPPPGINAVLHHQSANNILPVSGAVMRQTFPAPPGPLPAHQSSVGANGPQFPPPAGATVVLPPPGRFPPPMPASSSKYGGVPVAGSCGVVQPTGAAAPQGTADDAPSPPQTGVSDEILDNAHVEENDDDDPEYDFTRIPLESNNPSEDEDEREDAGGGHSSSSEDGTPDGSRPRKRARRWWEEPESRAKNDFLFAQARGELKSKAPPGAASVSASRKGGAGKYGLAGGGGVKGGPPSPPPRVDPAVVVDEDDPDLPQPALSFEALLQKQNQFQAAENLQKDRLSQNFRQFRK
ncbi:unnamed protein product [Amoebophrya sp. A120]|nr:unnamed protein product [Amoebophrya sp. A120]|eukprot:GSA120T00001867001.1